MLRGRKRRLEDTDDTSSPTPSASSNNPAPAPVPAFSMNATHPFLAATLSLYTPLGSSACSLFARKFQPEAAKAYAATVESWSQPGAAIASVRRRHLREQETSTTTPDAVAKEVVGVSLIQHGDRVTSDWQWSAEPPQDAWAQVALLALQQA